MKILFIQFGDYRDAFNNLATDGDETYKAQRHSVNYVLKLKQIPNTEVCVLCVNSKSDYDEYLANGIRVAGLTRNAATQHNIVSILDKFSPTHIVLRTPILFVIEYSLKKHINILPLFADYFSNRSLRSWYFNWKLARTLNNPAIAIISNHNLPACQSLAKLGVASNKIVPWDWPSTSTPDDFPDKPNFSRDVQLLYVGAVAEDKGTFDCIKAMDYLDYSRRNYTLNIIGPGALDKAQALVSCLVKPEKVNILGSIPNPKVIEKMSASNIVIVPSQHQYPEGMPNTIYESLLTKTPLIVSDHPVFAARFEDNAEVIFFKASQPSSLAQKIDYLVDNPVLYQTLSLNSKSLWLKLQMPLKWEDLISNWLEGGISQSQLLSKYAIANYN